VKEPLALPACSSPGAASQPGRTGGMAPPRPADGAARAARLTGEAVAPPRAPVAARAASEALDAPGGPAKARLLSVGLDAWNARLELIESAKTSLDASYFILGKDPYGYAFLGALLKKQLEGVKVRVSADAMADTFDEHGFKMPLHGKDFLQDLVNHGAQACVYHPVHERLLDGEPVAVFGPEDHLPADVLKVHRGKRNMWGNWVRNHVPQFQPLRHR